MKVRCVNKGVSEEYYCLTVGKTYEVEKELAKGIKIMNDVGAPYIYPHKCFEVVDEHIEIKRVVPEQVELFNPDNKKIGVLNNMYELLEIQIQIAEKRLKGYFIKWKEHHIPINDKGDLREWPHGMYDGYSKRFAELFKIRKEI